MSVTFKGADWDRAIARLEAVGEEAAQATAEVIRDGLEIAKLDIQHVIRTSVTPTGERRAAAGKGEPGRIETEKMIKAVETHMAAEGDTYISGRVGWLDDTSVGYKHAFYQEPGTRKVAGMGAIFVAYSLSIGRLKAAFSRKGFTLK